MNKLIQPCLLTLLIVSAWSGPAEAQVIANPLVRPAQLTDSASNSPNSNTNENLPRSNSSDSDSEDIRRQAARRITQEDLNVQQQALNSAVVPLALSNFFTNMQVTAHIQNAIVMRKLSNTQVQSPLAAGNSQATNAVALQDAAGSGSRNPLRSSAVVRLRVGQVVNIAGYSVRANVTGQDVRVDWLNDKGVWINVFFGALESSNGGYAQVPTDSQLLKVETDSFNYLAPSLNTQAFSSSGSRANQQGSGGTSGSSFGGAQSTGQPGFGSSTNF